MGAWMVSIDACEISPQDSSLTSRRDESEARELLKFPGPLGGGPSGGAPLGAQKTADSVGFIAFLVFIIHLGI